MTDKPKLHIPCEACGGKGYHDLNYQKGAPCPNCTRGFVPVDAVDVSDRYHTFAELYEHRHALFAALCRAYGHAAWKSRLHADGTMFDGGWFIAGIALPTGMITYHLPEKWWGLVDAQEWDKAPEWDGHTAEDVVNRIADSLVLHEDTKWLMHRRRYGWWWIRTGMRGKQTATK